MLPTTTNDRRPRVALPIIADPNYDQRMQRIAGSLYRAGYAPTLIGSWRPYSKPLKTRSFHQIRWRLPVLRGKLFYLLHNLRLFVHFLATDYAIFTANDLDSLPACYFAAKLKGKPLVYDAHEYFPELPEVVDRPLTKSIWQRVERWMVPAADAHYTINHAYAAIFKQKYDLDFGIVRNATVLESKTLPADTLKPDPYILYQGAVNVGRGVENMIEAMTEIDGVRLVICGRGDRLSACRQLATTCGVEQKVEFRGFVPPDELKAITEGAALGFTFFTDHGLSYRLSLANRFFDYFHCGVPQLAVDFPEYRSIVERFPIAELLTDLSRENIVQAVRSILDNPAKHARMRRACLRAREAINWQNEEKTLIGIYRRLVPTTDR